jgi:hypothetical protein
MATQGLREGGANLRSHRLPDTLESGLPTLRLCRGGFRLENARGVETCISEKPVIFTDLFAIN